VPRIFVSQRRIQQWTEEGRISVDGNVLTLPELSRAFRLTEAFHVERVVSEGGDTYRLTGKVKTRGQIGTLGGEVFLNSLIIGEAAYEGESGFIGEALPATAAQPVGATAASGRAVPPPAPPPRSRDAASQAGLNALAAMSAQSQAGASTMGAVPVKPITGARDRGSLLGVGPTAGKK
jgi:hypothetical protein